MKRKDSGKDGGTMFTAPPFARNGEPVTLTARTREYPYLPKEHHIVVLEMRVFACGDIGLIMACSCGAQGATVISNGGCGAGTHLERDAPPIDSLHLDLISLATSERYSLTDHGGEASSS